MKKYVRHAAMAALLLLLCVSITGCAAVVPLIGIAGLEAANQIADEYAKDWETPLLVQEPLLDQNGISVTLLHMEKQGRLGSYVQLIFHLQFKNESDQTLSFPSLSVLLNGYRFENAPELILKAGESATQELYATCHVAMLDVIGPVGEYTFNLDCFREDGTHHTTSWTAVKQTESYNALQAAVTPEADNLLNQNDVRMAILTEYAHYEDEICLLLLLENQFGATTLNVTLEELTVNGRSYGDGAQSFALDNGEKKLIPVSIAADELLYTDYGTVKSVGLTLKVKKSGVPSYLINEELTYTFSTPIVIK